MDAILHVTERHDRRSAEEVISAVHATKRALVVGLVTGLVLSGCGGEPAGDADPTPSPTTTSTATTTETETASATTSEEPTTPGTPAGRADAGATYQVVGVAHDDTLNVRRGPGPDFEIVAELEPTGSAVATGDDRMVESGLWVEVETDGQTGWANYAYLGLEDGTFDITSEVVDQNGGETPTDETMRELGLAVARLRATEDPPSRIEVVVAPSTGDLGEVTVDVLGLGDDSIKGERLHVFGTPSNGGFTLKSVESTLVCDRNVEDGTCV